MNIFFTADSHFFHKNIISYCQRPFKSVEEMHKVLIENWNKVVGRNDLVYHLGDFGMGNISDLQKLREKLNGQIVLIAGGHDKAIVADLIASDYMFLKIRHLLTLQTSIGKIVLCHYPLRVWDCSHYNSYHLFGHCHGSQKTWGKSYDVGVDTNNFTPLSLSEISNIMKDLPDNPNLCRGREVSEVIERHKNYAQTTQPA